VEYATCKYCVNKDSSGNCDKGPSLWMAVFRSESGSITGARFTGETGADGSGIVDGNTVPLTSGGYNGWYKKVNEQDYDPTINHLIISDVGGTHTWPTDTDDDMDTVEFSSGTKIVYMVLFSGLKVGYDSDGAVSYYEGVDYDESVFQSVFDGIVGRCHITQTDLPDCYCDNFRNGLTTDHLGEMACARPEVHGLSGVKNWCAMPSRPYIPLVDSGCPSDMFRCIVTHTPPNFPPCGCDTYVNGALPTSTDGLCQKIGTSTCSPRSYVGDKKIGGSEYYGCPEDMFRCTAAP